MKKSLIIAALLAPFFVSCAQYDDAEDVEQNVEQYDPMEVELLQRCADAAYHTHMFLTDMELCGECCCWEYVSAPLREKYESGSPLTVPELRAVMAGLESAPSFIDTLAEYDEFVDLDCFYRYGAEWFSEDYGL